MAGPVTQSALDRAYALHERSLPDTGVATFYADRFVTPSETFACALVSPSKRSGNRLEMESGAKDAYRLHVAMAAPALANADRVAVTHVALGVTTTVKVEVVDDQPAVTHQRRTSYAVKALS